MYIKSTCVAKLQRTPLLAEGAGKQKPLLNKVCGNFWDDSAKTLLGIRCCKAFLERGGAFPLPQNFNQPYPPEFFCLLIRQKSPYFSKRYLFFVVL